MKEPIEITLFWMIIFVISSVASHFAENFFLKKYHKQKIEIEKLRRESPNESYVLKDNMNKFLKSYAESLWLIKYALIIGAAIIFLRSFFD